MNLQLRYAKGSKQYYNSIKLTPKYTSTFWIPAVLLFALIYFYTDYAQRSQINLIVVLPHFKSSEVG